MSSSTTAKPTSKPSQPAAISPSTEYKGGIKPTTIKPATPPRPTGTSTGKKK